MQMQLKKWKNSAKSEFQGLWYLALYWFWVREDMSKELQHTGADRAIKKPNEKGEGWWASDTGWASWLTPQERLISDTRLNPLGGPGLLPYRQPNTSTVRPSHFVNTGPAAARHTNKDQELTSLWGGDGKMEPQKGVHLVPTHNHKASLTIHILSCVIKLGLLSSLPHWAQYNSLIVWDLWNGRNVLSWPSTVRDGSPQVPTQLVLDPTLCSGRMIHLTSVLGWKRSTVCYSNPFWIDTNPIQPFVLCNFICFPTVVVYTNASRNSWMLNRN